MLPVPRPRSGRTARPYARHYQGVVGLEAVGGSGGKSTTGETG